MNLLNKLLSRLPVLSWLNGQKTLIGAVLVVLAGVLDVLQQLATMFPAEAWIPAAILSISELLRQSEQLLNMVGMGFLTVGVVHKGIKKIDGGR